MIIVNFIGNEVEKYIRGLDQYDRGQILCISGLDLPKFVEVQFSLQETGGLAERIVGITTDGVTEVEIPNYMLTNNDATSDYEIYAYVYVTNETSAETVYKITMEVNSRPKPNPYDTPEDIGMFNRVIEVMKDSVTAAENAAGTSEKNAQKTGEDRKAIEEMVGTITGIEQQVQDVKEYAGQAKTAAENALLSEQEAKKSEGAALQHRTGAETAENNAELAEQNAKKSEQAVEQTKQLVMQMGQEVLQNKNQVDEKVEAFNKVVTDAVDAVGTVKTDAVGAVGTKGTEQVKKVSDEGAKQVKAVEDKGNEVLQSIPEDFTTQMQSKLDKNQGAENAGKILEIGIDGMVVPADKPSGGTSSGETSEKFTAMEKLAAGTVATGTEQNTIVDTGVPFSEFKKWKRVVFLLRSAKKNGNLSIGFGFNNNSGVTISKGSVTIIYEKIDEYFYSLEMNGTDILVYAIPKAGVVDKYTKTLWQNGAMLGFNEVSITKLYMDIRASDNAESFLETSTHHIKIWENTVSDILWEMWGMTK